MTAMVMAFLLMLAGVLQSLIPAADWLASSKTPFLLAVAIYYSLTHTRGVTATAAILAGVMQDSLSRIPVGYSAFCFVGFALGVHHLRGVLFRDSLVTVAVLGAGLGALTKLALYAMLLLGTDTVSVPLWWLLLSMAGSALLGLLVAPLVWLVAGMLERLVGIEHADDDEGRGPAGRAGNGWQ
jgi:rod shape-determining protein MreD